MGTVTRRITIERTLKLKPCPFCGGGVTATDCGYSSFNPGIAQCRQCGRKWRLGYVDDAYEAGQAWNKFQPVAKEIECLQAELTRLRKRGGVYVGD